MNNDRSNFNEQLQDHLDAAGAAASFAAESVDATPARIADRDQRFTQADIKGLLEAEAVRQRAAYKARGLANNEPLIRAREAFSGLRAICSLLRSDTLGKQCAADFDTTYDAALGDYLLGGMHDAAHVLLDVIDQEFECSITGPHS